MQRRPPRYTLLPYTTLFRSGLLVVADAAAVAVALGIGVEVIRGTQLRPVAILSIPFVAFVARLFGLYERPGRGLGRSTLKIGRAHVRTPVTPITRIPSFA